MTEEELKHWGKIGMKWGKRKRKVKEVITDPRTRGQKVTDFLVFGPSKSKTIAKYMSRGNKRSKAILKSLAPELIGASVVGGMMVFNNRAPLMRAGKAVVDNFILKHTSKNIVNAAGDIILNPRNYSVTREAVRLLR